MASLLPTVHLPVPVLLHALGLFSLGMYLTFTKVPSALGIAVTGLGLSYLLTSYVPIEQNQFLHASVPVRIILATLAAARLPTAPQAERKNLIILILYDFLGGVMVGYILGQWNGRLPGY
ncbi:class III chitinase [Histoplasma capsulatum G186AR]|uniref:Class III chitinase n=1 Tax=Ajellomyces capsulatus TaxID=5037 RepID=A0A8H7ZBE0_AJECA|nr:class III chitinase [Histoplasma capsulatum]QSS76162.1 class III chitinase [Histoplasma capsulatum G186AR]